MPVALELRRGQVTERGVQAFLVLDFFQEPADPGTSVGEVVIFAAIDLFVLEGFEKGLARRIIPGITFS